MGTQRSTVFECLSSPLINIFTKTNANLWQINLFIMTPHALKYLCPIMEMKRQQIRQGLCNTHKKLRAGCRPWGLEKATRGREGERKRERERGQSIVDF